MALSGFIKSLLQTDTVFGSEAKKVTGINDSIIQFYNSNVNASFLVNDTDNTFTFVINNYNTTITTPSWLIRDKYIKFFFFNFDTAQPQFQELNDYEGRLFQIGNVTVDSTAGTLTITFLPDALGTPPFNTSILPNIPSISNFDVRLDGRIFTLIGDPSIAREASNGSTMFNLDNENISSFSDADSSGIARKFASHYHTDVTAELVVHEKDNAGFDLVRIGLRDRALTQTIVYDEDEAKVQASLNPSVVNATSTFIEFTSGITTTKVAEYGRVAQPLKGIFMRMKFTTSHDDVPRGHGTEFDLTTHDAFTFDGIEWIVNLPPSLHTPTKRNWLALNQMQKAAKLLIMDAATYIVSDLNSFFGSAYIFSVGEVVNDELQILYEAGTPGLNTTEVTVMNRTTPPGNPILFHDASDVNPGTNDVPVTGIEFITQADLIAVLRVNQLNFTIADPGGVIIIGTDTDDDKTFTITVPTLDTPVFSNLVPANGLTNVPVNNGLFRTLRRHPDIVFDLDGNAVFSAPFFGVGV